MDSEDSIFWLHRARCPHVVPHGCTIDPASRTATAASLVLTSLVPHGSPLPVGAATLAKSASRTVRLSACLERQPQRLPLAFASSSRLFDVLLR